MDSDYDWVHYKLYRRSMSSRKCDASYLGNRLSARKDQENTSLSRKRLLCHCQSPGMMINLTAIVCLNYWCARRQTNGAESTTREKCDDRKFAQGISEDCRRRFACDD